MRKLFSAFSFSNTLAKVGEGSFGFRCLKGKLEIK